MPEAHIKELDVTLVQGKVEDEVIETTSEPTEEVKDSSSKPTPIDEYQNKLYDDGPDDKNETRKNIDIGSIETGKNEGVDGLLIGRHEVEGNTTASADRPAWLDSDPFDTNPHAQTNPVALQMYG